jgi:hypothetical protein
MITANSLKIEIYSCIKILINLSAIYTYTFNRADLKLFHIIQRLITTTILLNYKTYLVLQLYYKWNNGKYTFWSYFKNITDGKTRIPQVLVHWFKTIKNK